MRHHPAAENAYHLLRAALAEGDGQRSLAMGNTRALGAPAASAWCGHCGMGLATPPRPGSGGGVRCAFCQRVTRAAAAEHQQPGASAGEGGATTRAVAVPATPSPPRQPVAVPPAAGLEYPRAFGKKRALLVAVSYAGTPHELRGTANDVAGMRRLLVERFGFPGGCILELTEKDDQRDPARVPTRANLAAAMRWLVQGCGAGDSLVFHFSGHGVQKLDMNDDEVDGYNEALCPADFERAGKVLDDEINETIVRPLGPGVKLHAVVDTCHSGTILDLPYRCRLSRTGYWQWESHYGGHHPTARPPKGTSGGLAVSISGCNDHQKSADTSGFGDNSASIGAMTDSFIRAVEAEPGTTYGRLLSAMRARIRDGQGSRRLPGRLGSFVRRMIASSSVQEPQLCSSELFDIYRKPFLL